MKVILDGFVWDLVNKFNFTCAINGFLFLFYIHKILVWDIDLN